MGRTARTLRQRRLGKTDASRGRHCACSSRNDRDAPAVAHSWAARRAPSARLGRAVVSHGLHRACSARRDRDAPPTAHT
jgi:hypothetical protein